MNEFIHVHAMESLTFRVGIPTLVNLVNLDYSLHTQSEVCFHVILNLVKLIIKAYLVLILFIENYLYFLCCP